MHRAFMLAIALVLLVVFLGGCVNENEYSDTLSDWLRKDIENYFSEQYFEKNGKYPDYSSDHEDVVAGHMYFGTYNGYAIICSPPQVGGQMMEIDGRKFAWHSTCAYKNDEIFELKDLYESGQLTGDDLDAIVAAQNRFIEKYLTT